MIDIPGRNTIALIIRWILAPLFYFAKWFYLTLLPFILQYIAIPMFVLGILLALSFAGGTVLLTIVFFIVMFYFIKGVFFKSKAVMS